MNELFTPDIKDNVLFLSEEAIDVLIHAGVARQVFRSARDGFKLNTDAQHDEIRTAFAALLTTVAAQTQDD